MTKVTLTLQADEEHDEPYDEEYELDGSSDSNSDNSSSSILKEDTLPSIKKLTALEGSAINMVLDDSIQQLSIIKFMLNEKINSSWNSIFHYQPIHERFQTTPKKQKQFQEIEYEKIPYTNRQKLQKDVCFIITTLNQLCVEISEEGDYSVLINVLEGVKNEEHDNKAIESQTIENKAELENLNMLLSKEKKEFTMEISKAINSISILKTEVEDIRGYGTQEVRFTEDWEDTRNAQNEMVLTAKEDVHNNIIHNNNINIDHESRIHNEIVNFIEENCEDLKNATAYWMNEYETEVERRDSELIRLKMIWEELAEEHIQIQARYEERCAFIEEWRQINEDRRIAAELFKIQTAAAIKIQAWWRGTMVRKHLGPFRKKKKGKGKGKDKGKGKGGKGKKK